jgi:hypothetical protein
MHSELPGALQINPTIYIAVASQQLRHPFDVTGLQQVLARKTQLPVSAGSVAKPNIKPRMTESGPPVEPRSRGYKSSSSK